MKNFIARHLTPPLQDLIRGTNIEKEYKSLLLSETKSIDDLKKIQFTKLKRIVNHSHNNIPFYKDIFIKNNFYPSDLKSLEDLSKIPIIDKEMARNAGKDLYGCNENEKHIKYGKTGGTTGVPLFFKKDAKTRSVGWGAYYRWYNWLGLKRGDSQVTLWGAPSVTKNTSILKAQNFLKYELNNKLFINSFRMNNKTLPEIVKKIGEQRPKILHGYLSALIQLANYLHTNKISNIRPQVVIPTTETLLPPYRKFLEDIFKCKVLDYYGCGECGSIAFECPEEQGLHLTAEHCIMEVLDPDDEGVGDVVITDLDNYAMPFLRYKNGDKAQLSDVSCSCSRSLPLISRILGRSADTIKLKNGSLVHGVFFTNIMGEFDFFDSNKIRKFQVYQKRENGIEFRIEGEKLLSSNEKLLHNELLKHFDIVKITYYERIPLDSSGKFRYVISKIKKK